MNHMTRRSAISAAVMALASITLAGCDRTPNTIKIGVAGPLTGGLAALGKDLANGVQLAITELNKEGFKLNGKTVTLEMVVVDDKADPEEGKKVAQQLVDAGVVAVVGHLNSGVSIPAAPIYAAKNIAQLAISSNPKFTQLGFSTALRIVANDELQARAIGSFAASQLDSTKFAVIDEGTAYGKGLADAAASKLNGKKTITVRQSFDDKTKDFAALAAKLKAEGVQVVVSTLNDFQVVALIDALVKVDYNKQITILGTDTIKTTDMIKETGKVGAFYATSNVLEASEFSGGRAFLEAYQATFKIAPAYGGHYTYDATHVLAAAIRRAKSADPATITETLRKMDGFAPVTGSMKWNDKGEQRYGVVSVYKVNGGRWESIMRSDSW
jgi:branched-chain amino acid transport system substrate-binding protein